MTASQRHRGTTPLLLWGIATVFVCLYFSYSAIKGPYGLYEKGRIEARAMLLRSELAHLVAERESADNRARRLSDRFLDLDLLDEQVRRVIGMARSDEIIIR